MQKHPHPKKVLVITAHPDDPDFGAAGTVAKWTQQGVNVEYLIVTDGSKGSEDPQMTSERLSAIRKEEQNNAAKVAGVSQVHYLDFPDGMIFNTPELRERIVYYIRKLRPDLVITHDPLNFIMNNERINHPDHRNVGETTLDCIFPLSRDRLTFPEHEAQGLEPHKVLDILLLFTTEPNYFSDISDTLETKFQALAEHKSQIADMDYIRNRFTEYTKLNAEQSGEDITYAEAFRWIQMAY